VVSSGNSAGRLINHRLAAVAGLSFAFSCTMRNPDVRPPRYQSVAAALGALAGRSELGCGGPPQAARVMPRLTLARTPLAGLQHDPHHTIHITVLTPTRAAPMIHRNKQIMTFLHSCPGNHSQPWADSLQP
jgi:hypothetical protein